MGLVEGDGQAAEAILGVQGLIEVGEGTPGRAVVLGEAGGEAQTLTRMSLHDMGRKDRVAGRMTVKESEDECEETDEVEGEREGEGEVEGEGSECD